jgi:hypothetical protein
LQSISEKNVVDSDRGLRILGPVNHPFRVYVLVPILFVCADQGAAGAQSKDQVDANELLRRAVDKYETAKASKTRFTYLELIHTKNFNEKGKQTVNYSELFDVTYIADLEYSRLLEVNGKPLSGKALEDEQKRYDDAVRERSALDGRARAKIQHQRLLDAGIHVRDLLTDYRNTLVGRDMIEGCDCVLVDLTPVSQTARKHYRLWLDPETQEIRRLDFDQLADEGDLQKGGAGTKSFQYIDGIPLMVRSHFDGKAFLANKLVRVVSDHECSRFRKFSVTTTIIPAEAVTSRKRRRCRYGILRFCDGE